MCGRMECRPYGTGCVEPGPGPTAYAVGYNLSSLRDFSRGAHADVPRLYAAVYRLLSLRDCATVGVGRA